MVDFSDLSSAPLPRPRPPRPKGATPRDHSIPEDVRRAVAADVANILKATDCESVPEAFARVIGGLAEEAAKLPPSILSKRLVLLAAAGALFGSALHDFANASNGARAEMAKTVILVIGKIESALHALEGFTSMSVLLIPEAQSCVYALARAFTPLYLHGVIAFRDATAP